MNKNILKSIGAIFAGFVFIGITHNGTDMILENLGFLPKGNLWVSTNIILVVLAYRTIFSLIGSYITALLSPNNPMKHAIILGIIGFLLSTIGAIATTKMNLGPSWYAWTLVIISIPTAWLGGKLYEIYLLRHSQN